MRKHPRVDFAREFQRMLNFPLHHGRKAFVRYVSISTLRYTQLRSPGFLHAIASFPYVNRFLRGFENDNEYIKEALTKGYPTTIDGMVLNCMISKAIADTGAKFGFDEIDFHRTILKYGSEVCNEIDNEIS